MQEQSGSVGPGVAKRLGVVVGLFSLGCLPAISGPIGVNSLVVCLSSPPCMTIVSQAAPLSYSQAYQSNPSAPIINLTESAGENLSTLSLAAFNQSSEPVATAFYTQVNAVATVTFSFTISGVGSGFMAPVLDATGTTAPNALGQANIRVNGVADGGAMFFSNSAHLTFPLAPVTFGSPTSEQISLAAVVFLGPSASTGTADYSHTLVFDGLEVFDSQMSQLNNVTITGDGVQVPLVVPEPESILLFGLGLTAIEALRRKRRV